MRGCYAENTTVFLEFMLCWDFLCTARLGGSKKKKDPFLSETYLEKLPWLVANLEPTSFRLGCAGKLSATQRKSLKLTATMSYSKHNEDLLDILDIGGEENYRHLIQVLEEMKGMFPTVAAELKTAL